MKKRAEKAARKGAAARGEIVDRLDLPPTRFEIAPVVQPLVVGAFARNRPRKGAWASGLVVEDLTNPDRVRVFDSRGVAATLTVGAKTVVVRGQVRSFTEQKRVGAAYRDKFSRTTTGGLGLSPFYGRWAKPIGGADTDFTCDGSTGRIAVRSTNVGHYCTLRDGDVCNYDFRCRVTTTTAPAGASNSFALIGSYVNTSSHYRFLLVLTPAGNVRLQIEKIVDGAVTNLSAATTVGTGFTAGRQWWIRAQNVVGTLSVKAWKDGDAEPEGWTQTVEDSTLGEGRLGLRCFTTRGATNDPTFVLDEFEITSGEWAHPPVVSHDNWVRLLARPFDGVLTQALARQIRTWRTDTSPDALAFGFAFITGAPAVLDPLLGPGKKVLGEARYGPDKSDGARVEGADFNDYIGIRFHYRHLREPTVDAPESTQLGCLDCSGFVRMVFGFHLGVPMSLQDPADLNRLNLPRRSVQIGPRGPGVLIAAGSSAPPVRISLQIGDIVAFNADVADDHSGDDKGDVEETDDHVGIFIGRDISGNELVLSSRKTANGPTMGALGGRSQLNGDGFLAVALRHIRRI